MTETTDLPPDRLAVDASSPFHDPAALARGVGVRFRGRDRTDIEEYCISESWVRVQAGKAMDRHGKPLTLRLAGPVEAYWRS
jgi:hypothetical protein